MNHSPEHSKMSSRERMLSAFRRERPDHVPCSPYMFQGPWWPPPFWFRDQVERADRFLELGLDPTIDIWFPDPEPHPDVVVKTWRDTSGKEPLITKEYHTPAGVLRQVVRETRDWCDPSHCLWIPTTFGNEKRSGFGMELFDDHNVSRRVEPWFKGIEDLEKLRYIIRLPEGHVLDEWRMDSDRAREIARKRDVLLVARRTIVGDAFQWFCDIPDFMCWMVENPALVSGFLEIFQDWAMALTRLALEADVDVVQRRGWYEIPTYWGPEYYRQYILPGLIEESALVHQAGKLHCYLLPGGHCTYAEMLREANSDALFGIDPRMLEGGDLRRLFEQLGDCKSFWGGVDAEVTLQSRNPDLIDRAVKEAIEALSGNGGFILSAFLFQSTPQDSVRHMIESWKRYRNL